MDTESARQRSELISHAPAPEAMQVKCVKRICKSVTWHNKKVDHAKMEAFVKMVPVRLSTSASTLMEEREERDYQYEFQCVSFSCAIFEL